MRIIIIIADNFSDFKIKFWRNTIYVLIIFVQNDKKLVLSTTKQRKTRSQHLQSQREENDCIHVYNKAIKEQEKAKSCQKRHKNLPSRRLDIHYPYLLVKLTGVLDRIFRTP